MNPAVVREAHAVLSKHARSFRWASNFLPPDAHDDAAVVYAFCRLVDDLADETEDDAEARFALDDVERELSGEVEPRPLITAFTDVANRREIDLECALELIAGVRSDIGGVTIQTDEELLRYCYRVAGTVGLMMCGVLGVQDKAGHPHAIDLGVGMQLTNICRDVLEDAQRGRCYLPATRLREVGVTPEQLQRGSANRAAVARAVSGLLELAESYYESADLGLSYIPRRSRFAIVVASSLYRGIGVKQQKWHRGDALHGRTFVTRPEKIGWLGLAVARFARTGLRSNVEHDASLHQPLHGLPGTSKPAEF